MMIIAVFKKAAGFSLIEVLVALLVLSVGILGLIAMESRALKNNQSAYHRSQATILIYDLADRIRANKGALASYESIINPSDQNCAASTPCNSASGMAQQDLYQWRQKVTDVFPGGTSVSWSVASSGDDVAITLRWDDDRDGAITGDDPAFSTTFQP
ncbi:MAG: type IV pilus modification protein PilV [Motiliproteus sp.]